jgi:hypothetical protein
LGEPVFVTDKSAWPLPTVVIAVPLLFVGVESEVTEETVAVFVIVPLALVLTITTSVKTELPGASDAAVQEMVPFAPTAGVVHVQPAGDVSDTNVVPAGSVSDIATVAALLGPALLTVMV